MFKAVPPPIIRSSKLCTQHQVFVKLFLLLTAIMSDLELVRVCRSERTFPTCTRNTQRHIPEVVLIQLIFLMMSTGLLEASPPPSWRYTTHSGCIFYSPLSGFSLLAYEVT